MSQEVDLKEAERKVFRSTFQDGLVEIMLGSVVLMFAIAPSSAPTWGISGARRCSCPFGRGSIVFSGRSDGRWSGPGLVWWNSERGAGPVCCDSA